MNGYNVNNHAQIFKEAYREVYFNMRGGLLGPLLDEAQSRTYGSDLLYELRELLILPNYTDLIREQLYD